MRCNNSPVATSRRRLTPRGRRGHQKFAFETLERRLALALHIEDFRVDMDDANTLRDESKDAGYDSWDANPYTVPGGDTDADPNTTLGPDDFLIPHQSSGHVSFGYRDALGDPSYDLVLAGAGEWYEINFAGNRNQPGGLGPDGEVAAVGLEYIGVGVILFFGDNGIKTVNAKDWSRRDHVAVTSNDPSDSGFELGAIQKVRVTGGAGVSSSLPAGIRVDDIAVLVFDAGFSNNPPVAVDERAVVRSGAPTDIIVLNNDHDLDGDKLTIQSQLKTLPSQGIAEVQRVASGTDSIRYTSTSGYVGDDSFTYTVSDGRGGTDAAMVSISVETLVAVNDGAQTSPGIPVDIRVLENDIQPGGVFPLTLATSAQPNRGSATVHGGIITYTPNAGPPGRDEFTYTIHDGFGNSSTATVHVAVNNRPIAIDHEYKLPHGFARPYFVPAPGLLTGAIDPDGESLHAAASGETFENVTINADGSFIVSPSASGLVLPTTFAYGVVDEFGWSTSARVRLTVENSPPVAENATVRYPRGASGPVSLTFYYDDADGDEVTLELIDEPTKGRLLSVRSGTPGPITGRRSIIVEYDTDNHVLPLTDQFAYRLSDGYSTSEVVTATIAAENNRPQVITSEYVGGISILTSTGTAPVTGLLYADEYSTQIEGPSRRITELWSDENFTGDLLAVDADYDALYPILENTPLHGSVKLIADSNDLDGWPDYYFEYIPNPPPVRIEQAGLAAVVQNVFALLPDDRNAAIVAAATRLAGLADAEFFSTEELLDSATELLRDTPITSDIHLTDAEIQTFQSSLAGYVRPDPIFRTDKFSYRVSDGIEESANVIYVTINQSLGAGALRTDAFHIHSNAEPAEKALVIRPSDLLANDRFESGLNVADHYVEIGIGLSSTADYYWYIYSADDPETELHPIDVMAYTSARLEPNDWLVFVTRGTSDDYQTAFSYEVFVSPPGLPQNPLTSELVSAGSCLAFIEVTPGPQLDFDGVDDSTENGVFFPGEDRNGDNAVDPLPLFGDGNGDYIFDALQPHVASLPSGRHGYVTLVSTPETPLLEVQSIPYSAMDNVPSQVDFPLDILSFKVIGLARRGATTVTLILPPGVVINTYYKYGHEFNNPSTPDQDEFRNEPHWYEFLWNGTTGAQFFDNNGQEVAPHSDAIVARIVLHLEEFKWGDGDYERSREPDGVIADPGGPAFIRPLPIQPLITISAISGPRAGVPGQLLSYAASFNGGNPATNFTAEIDWGDGAVTGGYVAVSSASGLAEGRISCWHTYTTLGDRIVRLTLRDGNNNVRTAELPVTVQLVTFQPDPFDPARQALVVGGFDSANDRIVFQPDGGGVRIAYNGYVVGPFVFDGSIVAFGQGGDDTIRVDQRLMQSAMLFGQEGNDTLVGSAGTNVLVGGAGNDQLLGYAARDLLFGGLGADLLYGAGPGLPSGDQDSDVLSSDYTAWEHDPAMLALIHNRWQLPGSYEDRLQNLRYAASPALNNTTVFNDFSVDRLIGGPGLDWLVSFNFEELLDIDENEQGLGFVLRQRRR